MDINGVEIGEIEDSAGVQTVHINAHGREWILSRISGGDEWWINYISDTESYDTWITPPITDLYDAIMEVARNGY